VDGFQTPVVCRNLLIDLLKGHSEGGKRKASVKWRIAPVLQKR
jgi:hypothetical protein